MMKLGFYKSYKVVTAPVHYDSGPVGYSRKTYQQNRRRSDRERQKKEKKKKSPISVRGLTNDAALLSAPRWGSPDAETIGRFGEAGLLE